MDTESFFLPIDSNSTLYKIANGIKVENIYFEEKLCILLITIAIRLLRFKYLSTKIFFKTWRYNFETPRNTLCVKINTIAYYRRKEKSRPWNLLNI